MMPKAYIREKHLCLWCWENWISAFEQTKLDLALNLYKNQLKMDENFNVTTRKLQRENLQDIGKDFLRIPTALGNNILN